MSGKNKRYWDEKFKNKYIFLKKEEEKGFILKIN